MHAGRALLRSSRVRPARRMLFLAPRASLRIRVCSQPENREVPATASRPTGNVVLFTDASGAARRHSMDSAFSFADFGCQSAAIYFGPLSPSPTFGMSMRGTSNSVACCFRATPSRMGKYSCGFDSGETRIAVMFSPQRARNPRAIFCRVHAEGRLPAEVLQRQGQCNRAIRGRHHRARLAADRSSFAARYTVSRRNYDQASAPYQ